MCGRGGTTDLTTCSISGMQIRSFCWTRATCCWVVVLVSVCVSLCFSTFHFLLSALGFVLFFSFDKHYKKKNMSRRGRSRRQRSKIQWAARQRRAGQERAGKNSKFKIQAPLEGAGRTIIEMDSIRLQPPLGSCRGGVRGAGGAGGQGTGSGTEDQFCIFGLCKHNVCICHVTCARPDCPTLCTT